MTAAPPDLVPSPPSRAALKALRLMLAWFGVAQVPQARVVHGAEVPAPYHDLLVHHGHMTEVLERHHGAPVRVQPYQIHQHGELYGRRLDLRVGADERVIMTGLMIINLATVPAAARSRIVAAREPLGRILIEHRVLRRVAPDAYLHFSAADPLAARFGLRTPRDCWGRLATITCDGAPAVDLLEVVRPE
jgi:chorismate-pyruvate lyase